ncbi:ACSL4 [Cordylochernes scorpioides]|uniref:long-chain-fatty-acid--CoA ligase n=1 Tax=Cordylochernes scorpioides TaxID=51811 RepID=A0ABY6KR88_9ARAC|nr:ACSL4 [Cordylochernes scorpioides]
MRAYLYEIRCVTLSNLEICVIETSEPWYVALVVAIVKVYALIFDIATWPLYFIFQQLWKHRNPSTKLLRPDDPSAGYTRLPHARSSDSEAVGTINRMFDIIVERNGDSQSFGTRKILGVHREVQTDGKIFKKFDLADHYEWITYRQAGDKVRRLSRALLALGLQPGGRLAIYAETRVEWMLTAQACFRLDITIKSFLPFCYHHNLI